MSADNEIRAAVCRAMRAEMDIWMPGFAQAAYAIPKGLLDGTLPEEIITGYPVDKYPEGLSKNIAHAVGLPFHDETIVFESGGWRRNVDAEEISTGIEVLRAIPEASASFDDDPDDSVWRFSPENILYHDLTIEQVRDVMRGLSLRDAAQLLMDAHGARP